MFNTSTKKVIRDLLQEKRRTFTVLLAMVLGVFAVAMMSTSKSLLDNNLTDNFLRTNPASFSLFVNNIDESVLKTLSDMDEIDGLTTRQSIWVRMKKDDGTFLPILLYVVDDVADPQINTYTLDEGTFPQAKTQLVIERTGKKLEYLYAGQTLELHFPGYTQENFTLSGFTHDAGIAPSWMEGYLYAYISASSLPATYRAKFATEIKCTVSKDKLNRKHIESIAKHAEFNLEQKGLPVLNSEIHEPGVHMHQKQMNALMFLILNFGVLVLILSCFLIINMISAIMAKEIKQIAIMKSTGASTFQIARIYISTTLLMSIASIITGMPLGIAAGKAFARFNASMLNFELFNTSTEPLVILIIIITGVFLPLFMSFFPIIKSSRISVQQALNDTGIEGITGQNHLFSAMGRWFSGSFVLALKNAFRRKTRLALTVFSLAIGGAIFITAFNIRQSTQNSINRVFDEQPQDILYTFTQAYSKAQFDNVLSAYEIDYELGFKSSGSFIKKNGLNSNAFSVTAIAQSGSLIVPVITEGRWIEENKNEVVINQILLKENPEVKIGDKVLLSIKGKNEEYTLVGMCKEMFTPGGLFMLNTDYSAHIGAERNVGNILLVDAKTEMQKELATLNINIENAFKEKQLFIINSLTKSAYKTAVVEHLLIIMAMLLSMTFLVVIVGGMGMATSMNINVSERIRELGILRAIGIFKKDLRMMVMTESVTMGVLSWLIAILVSIPLSWFLGNQFFTIFFESSMQLAISHSGILLWLLIAVLIGSISSILPANRVIKRQITDALNYE